MAPRREALQLMALAATSAMVILSSGYYSVGAVAALGLVCVLTLLACKSAVGNAARLTWLVVLVGCAAVGAFAYYETSSLYQPLIALLACSLALIAVIRDGRPRQMILATSVVVFVVIVATQWQWGYLQHDVFRAINAGTQNLLHLHNPYDATYLAKVPTAPGQFDLAVGYFPYGPGVALLALPGVVAGDARLMDAVGIAAIFCAAAVLARRGGSRGHVVRAVALCVAFPLFVPMIHFAWVDSMTLGGLAAWLVLRERHHWWAAVVLGLALAAKPIFLPALVPFFLWSKPARKQIIIGACAAFMICVPFIIVTGPVRFWTDTIGVHTTSRYDALTLTSLLYGTTGRLALPGIVAAGAVLAAVGLACRRAPRDLSDALCAGSFICVVTFAFSNQAYTNYYFQSACLLVLAVAARGVPFEATGGRVVSLWEGVRRQLTRPQSASARHAGA